MSKQINTDETSAYQSDEMPTESAAESITGNEIGEQELAGISKDNIIEGERSTRAKDFAKADDELDAQVDNLE